MAGQLRVLKKRIRSVENTRKITRAMEMVATAKFHRYQSIILKSRAFSDALETLLKRVSLHQRTATHAFLRAQEEKRTALVLMTSDTGLCGSYNNELIEKATEFISTQDAMPLLIGVGKSGINALKSMKHEFQNTFMGIRISQTESTIEELRRTIERTFLEAEVDAVYVIYTRCPTLSSYRTVTEKLLPIQEIPYEENQFDHDHYIYEPSPDIVFQKLIASSFEARVRQIFLEAFVSEQIARMTAMHQATDNATEMLDSLTLQRNKARQGAITSEIIEVISGSRALKE